MPVLLLMPSFLQPMLRRRASCSNGVLARQEVLEQRVLHNPCSPALLLKERKYSGRYTLAKKKQYNKKIAEVKSSSHTGQDHILTFFLIFWFRSSVVFAYSPVLIPPGKGGFFLHKFSSVPTFLSI